MICKKQLILTGFKVQYIDLREPKPRTPIEETYVVDSQWTEAMGVIGFNVMDAIKSRYEKGGYHVLSLHQLKPKRVVDMDLHEIWYSAESLSKEEHNESSPVG